MSDPFPSSIIEGQWGSITGARELVFMGGDRMLEWEPQSGTFRLWDVRFELFAARSAPGEPDRRRAMELDSHGHELVYLFEDRLLDWEPATGRFRIWQFDRHDRADPLPRTICEGQWGSIKSGHELIYLDGDQVLDWEKPTGAYRFWRYDRNDRSDPFPGDAIVQGSWSSIKGSREFVYLSRDRVLDWEPHQVLDWELETGRYRVWRVAV